MHGTEGGKDITQIRAYAISVDKKIMNKEKISCIAPT
jgi:hypothetical protein